MIIVDLIAKQVAWLQPVKLLWKSSKKRERIQRRLHHPIRSSRKKRTTISWLHRLQKRVPNPPKLHLMKIVRNQGFRSQLIQSLIEHHPTIRVTIINPPRIIIHRLENITIILPHRQLHPRLAALRHPSLFHHLLVPKKQKYSDPRYPTISPFIPIWS